MSALQCPCVSKTIRYINRDQSVGACRWHDWFDMDAVWIIAIVLGVIILCGYCNFEMWRNRRHNAWHLKMQAEDRAKRDAKRDKDKRAGMAIYLELYGEADFIEEYGEAEFRKMFREEGTVEGIAGAHGVPMQFYSAGMPQNVTHQYVTVVTQPY